MVMDNNDKAAQYRDVHRDILAVIKGEPSPIARFATAACLLAQAFAPRFYWTGFYLVDPQKEDELVVGPYQGTLGCLRIPFTRGVCGAAARKGVTQLVRDVHAISDHIACDSATNSEIVVPVFDRDKKLIAVLDIDSTQKDAFDAQDQSALEAICADLLTVN